MDEERKSTVSGLDEEPQQDEEGVQMQTEQVKVKKPRRPLKVIRVQDFTDKDKGLRILYDAMAEKAQKLESRAQLQPDKSLKDYVSLIKEWAFNMAPKYEFDYMMERTRALGRKSEIQEELSNLRLYHQGKLVYNTENQLYQPASSSDPANTIIKAAKARPVEKAKPQKPQLRLTADQGPVAVSRPRQRRDGQKENHEPVPYTLGSMEPEDEVFNNYADEEDLAYPIKKLPKPIASPEGSQQDSRKSSPGKMKMENFQTFGD